MILHLDLKEKGYDIVVERGCLKKAGDLLNLNRKVLVVTDSGVPEEYSRAAASAAKEGYIFTFEQGEERKNFDTYQAILGELLEKGFNRHDAVVAVGGGVAGDMAGFAAATFMRGIDFYNIPTTLLSQVDSSIGGKTAIDFHGVKNIVGAFYQPKKVLIDPDTLTTLPDRQISNGMAEALKMSMTSDPALFDLFEKDDPCRRIDDVIIASLKIKKNVVEIDEKEAGLRKILNFGHTFGHGIEAACSPELYHGECVALGMLFMMDPSLRNRVLAIYRKLNLPLECSCNMDDVIDAVAHDKKGTDGAIECVYVPEIGKHEIIKLDISELRNRFSGKE